MKNIQTDLLQGTLDLLVLKTLQTGPTHGWDIAQRIQQVSRDVLRVGQGSTRRSTGWRHKVGSALNGELRKITDGRNSTN